MGAVATHISHDPPVTYVTDYIPAAQDVFDILWRDLPWENREGAPRRECWMNHYGLPYTYGSGEFARTYQPVEYHPLIRLIEERLNLLGSHAFDCCFVNGYAHGRQHLGWHADDSPEMDHEHGIAVISLGSARDIWFRRKVPKKDDQKAGQPLAPGSLLLMRAGMQRDWLHRIPKSPISDIGPRLSLTFRKLVR